MIAKKRGFGTVSYLWVLFVGLSVRITAGIAGGRKLIVPKGIRPTQDRIREAYFSKMGGMVSAGRFLDLYAGSGAVGIEAWSRGCPGVVLVEQNRRTAEITRRNIEEIAEDGVQLACADVMKWTGAWSGEPFLLVYADPPYDEAEKPGFAAKLLECASSGSLLDNEGIFTLERKAGYDSAIVPGWVLMDSRRYGGSALDFYIRKTC